MAAADECAAGFVEQALRKAEEEISPEAAEALKQDAAALGLFGLLACLACPKPPEILPDTRQELEEALVRDLCDALGQETGTLTELVSQYLETKGERGGVLLSRLLSRVIFEVYDLAAHHFIQEDVLLAGEVMAWGGSGQDARETAKRITRLSRTGARQVLGHLDSQLDLVHRIADPEMPLPHALIDTRLHHFAPRVFAQRLPSLAKILIHEEKRFRFVFVLWGRLRGLVLGRQALLDATPFIIPKEPLAVIRALEERKETRAVFRRAVEEAPLATTLEEVLRSRVLALPDPA